MNIKQTIKKSFSRATLTMLATFLIAMTAQTAWATTENLGGYDFTVGTDGEGSYYVIDGTAALNALRSYVNTGSSVINCSGKRFKMIAPITYDGSENNFTPIGDNSHWFSGTFDGQGYTISGININNSEGVFQAIFGYVDGTVKNLVVSDCNIAAKDDIGGIAGKVQGGTIENCHVGSNVSLSAYSRSGGIAGTADGATIKGCTSAATITGVNFSNKYANCLGGIAGKATKAGSSKTPYLTDNLFTGAISDNLNEYIGAIVGENQNNVATLTNNVHISSTLGGIGEASSTTGTDGDGARRAYSIAAGENVTVDFAGDAATVYSPKGISVYAAGMKYAGVLYVGGTADVSLSLSSDYPILDYSATNGTLSGTATTGSNDAYTLTMANEASTITATIALWGEMEGKDGTSEEKAFIITTPAGLDLLAKRVNDGITYEGKYFKLDDNITYDKTVENNFTPISDVSHWFSGTFDGQGYTISGININNSEGEFQAIFGYVSGGTVKNLVVSNCNIAAKRDIGGIAGKVIQGTIENCHVDSNVSLSAWKFSGGIAGIADGATIKGCTSAATITGVNIAGIGAEFLGGIAGQATNAGSQKTTYLTDNLFTGAISDNLNGYIGAIVGQNYNNVATLTNNVHISSTLGGIGEASSTTGTDGDGARRAYSIAAAEGVTIAPTGETATYDVSGITAYADNDYHILGYDSKLYAGVGEAAKLSIAYTVPDGYKFIKINAGEDATVTPSGNDYTMTMPASDVTVDVNYQAITYKITYAGVEGATFPGGKIEQYTVERATFELTDPEKEGYVFAGWTYEGQTTPTETVTIDKGSTGDKAFTANWKKLLSNEDITVGEIADQTYTGEPIKPAITVMDGKTDITDQCDFSFVGDCVVGTATAYISAKESSAAYAGQRIVTFEIIAADGDLTPPTPITGLVYTSEAQDLINVGSSTTGSVVYSLDGTNYSCVIPQGTDAKEYEVYYMVEAGNGYNEVAPASLKVTIAPKTVSTLTITLSGTSFEYTGVAIEPWVKVEDGDDTIPEEEYTVSYKNNIEVGTATVTITDNEGGNYIVSGSTTFEITAPEKKVISDTNLVPIDGKNFYVPTEETLEAIKETFDASFGLFKEDVNRVELTEKGGLKFSKGSDIQMIVLGGNLHEIVKFVFTGKMYGNSKMLRQLKANTRGDGDASTDGDLELVSGADYEVIEDGDLILTIALEDEEAVIEGISVNKPDEPDEADEDDDEEDADEPEPDPEPDPEPTSVTIEIGKNGKTTYTGSEALDFSGTDDVKAYVATGYESDGTVWLTRVKQVPAGEPVLIKGTKNTSYEIPTLKKCRTLLMNMFMGSADEELTISTTSHEGYYQNFYMAGGKFKPVPEKYTLTAGKCYLSVPAYFKATVSGEDQTVKISKSGKSSYAPPVDVDLTTVEGLKAYVATGYDPASQTIWLTRVMRIQAGEGVILKGEAGKTYTLPSKAVQAMYYSLFIANNEEKITINETSESGDWTNFYLADGKFKKVSGTQEIGINKSYLVLPTWFLESNNSARGKKTAGIDELTMEELETETMLLGSIGGDDEDGTTRIDAIAGDDAQSDVYYNLQGQRVDTPKKGLYIKNGVKVVVK